MAKIKLEEIWKENKEKINVNFKDKDKKNFSNRIFEREFSEFQGNHFNKVFKKNNSKKSFHNQLVEEFEEFNKNKNYSNKEKFFLFCAISTFFRKKEWYDENKAFVDSYKKSFLLEGNDDSYFPLYKHIELMANELSSTKLNDNAKIWYIKKAYDLLKNDKDHELLGSNSGVVNSFSMMVADYFEDNLEKRYDVENMFWITTAIDLMKEIANSDESEHARYNSTYGRLLALDRHYSKGVDFIKKAIKKEEDESLKVEYNDQIFYILAIKSYDSTRDKSKEIEIKLKDVEERAKKNQKKMYKIASIAVSILSLIFGAISVTLKAQDISTIATILLLFFATLSIFTSSLSFFFVTYKKKQPLSNFHSVLDILTLQFSIERNHNNFSKLEIKKISKELKKYSYIKTDKVQENYEDEVLYLVSNKTRKWLDENKYVNLKNFFYLLVPILLLVIGLGIILFFFVKYMS